MESMLENIVPQAGNLGREGNTAIDSDRVKAPVVGAGSTDFGGEPEARCGQSGWYSTGGTLGPYFILEDERRS